MSAEYAAAQVKKTKDSRVCRRHGVRRPKEHAEIGERVLSQLRKRGINMENKRLIELVNVSKDYDGDVALNNINLYIRDGEFLTLLGPSGCGKTTLLRLIAGFIMPSSGKIMMDGKELTNVPPYKRRVNTVFQKYALFSHLNVFENVAFGLKIRKLPKDEIKRRVTEMLELVNLAGYENVILTSFPADSSSALPLRVRL